MSMLSCLGFSAWITIGDEMLPVYQQETVGSTCTAWIPSTAGQAFSVWWKNDSKARVATSGHVFVDGHDVASAIMRPGRSKPVERTGAKTSSRRLRPFTFSVLRLTDDDTVANKDDPSLQDMGAIKIEISRVKLGDEVPFKAYNAQDHGMVHEKAKKLGVHCTSYGPSKRAAASRTVAVTTAPYDAENPGPYVTFLFKYRSADLLRANGIIRGLNNKRNSPHDDDEIIQISDSDDDDSHKNKTDKGRPAKKSKLEVDEEEASSPPPESSDADLANEVDDVSDTQNGVTDTQDVEMENNQLDFGAPSLLQQQAQQDETQTQVDDESQFNLGAASLLQQGNGKAGGQTGRESQDQNDTMSDEANQSVLADAKEGKKKGDNELPRVQAISVAVFVEESQESQLEVDDATQMIEESQEL